MSELKKRLNLYGLTMIAVGCCIGAGIFKAPGDVANGIDSHALVLCIWLLGGLISMMGALTFSELGALFPKSGGVYVYLKEAYGELVGFLYGWAILFIITSGALAFLAGLFGKYMVSGFPALEAIGADLLAVFVILILTGINIFGVNIIQLFSNLFTGLKLLAIFAIIIVGIWFVNTNNLPTFELTFSNVPEDLLSAVFVGLVGVFFSFGGWHHSTYLSGETINASKTVPRAMVYGVAIVTIVYLLINYAYMLLLPLPELIATDTVAAEALTKVYPSWGGKAISVMVAISVLGTIGIYTVTAPRIYFAMAKDKIFFKALAYVHPTYKTPVVAMVIQSLVACFLILAFDKLSDLMAFVTFMDILFMTLAGISIFVFRQKLKDTIRAVSVPFYPVVPLLYILPCTAFVYITFTQIPGPTRWAMLIMVIGVLFFYVFKRFNSKKA